MAGSRSYKSQMTILGTASLGAAALAGLVGSQVLNRQAGPADFWLTYLPLLALCAFAFWAMTPWWRRLDDLQRQGQQSAWFWGGQIGGIVVLMALVAAAGRDSDLARGGLYVVLGQAVGFAVAWLVWRWRSSGPAE
ncbi:MAG TPA: hypothetical protein VFV30_07735 [Novosphingobium sp.]|nr:hypothetical protein [Novosphingobium sp.]